MRHRDAELLFPPPPPPRLYVVQSGNRATSPRHSRTGRVDHHLASHLLLPVLAILSTGLALLALASLAWLALAWLAPVWDQARQAGAVWPGQGGRTGRLCGAARSDPALVSGAALLSQCCPGRASSQWCSGG